jgi:DNA-binding GntR family transcriptional regulator
MANVDIRQPVLPPVPIRTLSDQAFTWLEEAIVKGEIPAGAKLDEVALARQLGISRAPVREAIRRLEGKKLVERVPQKGARVAALSSEELGEILLIREALEGLACRLAAERMTDAETAELARLLEQHSRERALAAGDHYYQRPGDYDFHYRIIQGSRNRKLVEMLCGDLYYLMRVYRYRSSARIGRAQEALEEHRVIVAAIAAHDGAAAEAAMRQHLSHARIAVTSPATAAKPA